MSRVLHIFSLFCVGLVIVPTASAQQNINHLTVNQWIHPVEDGTLIGRIVIPSSNGALEAVPNASVAMLSRDGEVIRTEAKTNSKGAFLMKGVKPGVYALTARAENVFACCAMHIIDDKTAAGQAFPSEAEIAAAKVDYTMVNTAIIRYLPPKYRDTNTSIETVNLESISKRVCGEGMFRVAQSEGGMKGQLHPAGARGEDLDNSHMTNVFVIKDGMEVGRAITDEQGNFKIESLSPGEYSLMAVGPDGLGLVGFELVDPNIAAQAANALSNGDQTLVAKLGGCCCNQFAMQVAPMPEVINVVEEVVVSENSVETVCGGCGEAMSSCNCDVPVDPCGCGGAVAGDGVVLDEFGSPIAGGGYVPGGAGGGFGGGGGGGFYGGGGGGGGFGGGGLGGLAGLAGTIGVIAATTSNDNPVVIPVPPTQTNSIPAN